MRANSFESSLPKLGLLAGLSFLGAALAPEAVMSRVAGQAPPPTISLTVTIRDFKAWDQPGGHPDFERNKAISAGGIAKESVRTRLNYDRRPVFKGGTPMSKPGGNYQQWRDSMGRPICWVLYDSSLGDTPGILDPTRPSAFTTAANFDQWYHDVPGVNLSMTITLTLNLQADGTYVYDDKADPVYGNGGFFPIDGQLFGNSAADASHNFHFTTELHAQFTYDAAAGQIFKFTGDDDVWVFINGEIVVELSGTHRALDQYVDLTRLGLADGEIYTFDLFHAERQTDSSNFRFQTNLVLENTPITTMISAPFD